MLKYVATIRITDKETASKVRQFFANKEEEFKRMSVGKPVLK